MIAAAQVAVSSHVMHRPLNRNPSQGVNAGCAGPEAIHLNHGCSKMSIRPPAFVTPDHSDKSLTGWGLHETIGRTAEPADRMMKLVGIARARVSAVKKPARKEKDA